jgi:hypothetical protein
VDELIQECIQLHEEAHCWLWKWSDLEVENLCHCVPVCLSIYTHGDSQQQLKTKLSGHVTEYVVSLLFLKAYPSSVISLLYDYLIVCFCHMYYTVVPFHCVVAIQMQYLLSLLQLLLHVIVECLMLLPFVQEDHKFDSLLRNVRCLNYVYCLLWEGCSQWNAVSYTFKYFRSLLKFVHNI